MRALVVEDHPPISSCIKEALEAQGLVVDVAGTGTVGLDLAAAFPYDLVVLDRMLPEVDGDTVCRSLRVRGLKVPILMLTAKDALEDKVQGLDLGADDYMVKPFAVRELQARARALLRRRLDEPANVLSAGDLTIDLDTQEVHRGQRSVALGRKEFVLLTYLLRHRGRVVTKEELLDHLWDEGADPCEETVRTHIKNLRRKIDGPDDFPLIKTIYGVGYKVEG